MRAVRLLQLRKALENAEIVVPESGHPTFWSASPHAESATPTRIIAAASRRYLLCPSLSHTKLQVGWKLSAETHRRGGNRDRSKKLRRKNASAPAEPMSPFSVP